MKKKIAILGSTGSIGENTLRIIRKDKKNFEITLLSTNKNLTKILKQAKEFKVKNVIINDLKSFQKAKLKIKNTKIKIFNKFDIFNKVFKRKSKIKNTGNIIPGHGGLLDRIDGMIFAFPYTFILIKFIWWKKK